MTATEKRYGQTEKRCFSCTLGKGQVQHLPPWSIKGQDQYSPQTVTSSIQQATAQLPPIIEIWVLGMQNVDFELVYKPGIADAGLHTRHVLPKKCNGVVEKVIKYDVKANHALVVDHIIEEIHKYLKNFRNCPSEFDLEWQRKIQVEHPCIE